MALLYGFLADVVVLIHLAFVVFAVLGAILAILRRWADPAALAGCAVGRLD